MSLRLCPDPSAYPTASGFAGQVCDLCFKQIPEPFQI
ncbi:hypothetical protein SAMN05444159_5491 [Bradyrhizobium lablabi]|uniref:Uncharacterized protein n=1 Tax=Bradyrhizobium lablabi TaxID=722472 RepID=A0A1M6ZAS8_9BRAD|nr:hypothetical protein SAMN05444159_5491 [Bradyrhizobium lablabi]